jgi:hypothetical protein
MINRARIEDWIRQAEALPAAAPLIIRQIAGRFIELDEMNEKLRAENLALSSGEKVREYEQKLAELEFQIAVLKRQAGGAAMPAMSLEAAQAEMILYNEKGQILRFGIQPANLEDAELLPVVTAKAAATAATAAVITTLKGDWALEGRTFGLLPVAPNDTLLLIFSSGRTVSLPLDDIPPMALEDLDWTSAFVEEPRPMEEMVAVMPITRLAWFGLGAQISRFGYGKRVAQNYLKTFMTNASVGRGTKFDFDRLFRLVLCNEDDLFVMASKLGNFQAQAALTLPLTLDEVIRFKAGDYLVAAFTLGAEQNVVVVTQDGYAAIQKPGWMQPEDATGRKNRVIVDKRPEGWSLSGAAPASAGDWGLLYRDDRSLVAFDLAHVTARGNQLYPQDGTNVMALTCFTPARMAGNEG